MPTNALKNAIISTLDRIGRERILEIAPELGSLEGWTSETLAGIMMDKNDVIRDEKHQDHLIFLKDFFCGSKASQNEQKPQFDRATRSLASMLRYQSQTVGIKYRPGNTPQSITALVGMDVPDDYLPVIGVAIGKEMGPLKAALDSIFSDLHWDTALPGLSNQLVTSVLRLWREVLQVWIQANIKREISPEIEFIRTNTAARVPRAKARRSSVPVIEIDIEPTRPAQDQGRKRSRSVKDETPPLRLRKRRIILTPPGTPAGDELANGRMPAPVRSQFIAALIEAIPPYARPIPNMEVDVTYMFRRQKFSEAFGSGGQGLETSWRHQPKYRENRPLGAGSEHLIGGQTKFNPHFPQHPCAPGLLFRAPGLTSRFGNGGNAEPYPNTVLFQVAESKWLYLGEYVVKHKGSLPRAEWLSSSPQSKREWVQHCTEKGGRYAGPLVSAEVMREWLDKGVLNLEVYEMKCVDYHVVLQAKIIELGL